MTPPRLALDRVSAGYDGALVLKAVSLEVRAGECVALVGPSGAGKTTLLRAIMGLTPIRHGAIWLEGMRLGVWPPYRMAALGVAAMPEGRRLFDELTVRENLLLGAYPEGARRHAAETLADVERLFPPLRTRRDVAAGVLSGGEQQMVALGRSLMARPRLLLLDDPFLGLAKAVIREVADALRALAESRGVAILATGQHVRRLLRLAHRGYLLDGGSVTTEGRGADLLADPRVGHALLDFSPRTASGVAW